jgi:hypothetical protein
MGCVGFDRSSENYVEIYTEKRISSLLGTHAYHAAVDVKTQDHIFTSWVAGNPPVIACTPILGPGVDQPVRDSVHVGGPSIRISKSQPRGAGSARESGSAKHGKNTACMMREGAINTRYCTK